MQLQKVNIIDQYIPGTAVLEKIGNIAFFDDRDPKLITNFDVDGCKPNNCEIIGTQILRLTNRKKEECTLQLTSEKAVKRWYEEITQMAALMKNEQDVVLQRASTLQLDQSTDSSSVNQEEFHDASEEINNDLIKFQFEFTAPKICLQLNTPAKGTKEEW